MYVHCIRMDNHSRSKKHAENVSRLLLELGDDAEEDNKDNDNVDDAGNLSAADAEDVEVADDLPDLSQSRYHSVAPAFVCFCCKLIIFKNLKP